jgi:hypothetical protein
MNDLAVVDPHEEQRLKEMMGVVPEAQSNDRVPLVKINLDDEDEAGNQLPRGTMYLRDHSEIAYAKNIKIRVLGQHYQYIEYDPELNKTVCKTYLNKSFRQEFLDTRGTSKCGMTKPKSKMEQYEKERFKNVTCFRQLRVLTSYEGVDALGKTVKIDNQPAIMLLKGSNFMPFEDEVVKKLPNGASVWDFWINVTLERKKNGSVTYYVMHYDFDTSSVAPFDIKTAETVRTFADMVESENSKILSAHKTAISERSAGEYTVAKHDNLEADFE